MRCRLPLFIFKAAVRFANGGAAAPAAAAPAAAAPAAAAPAAAAPAAAAPAAAPREPHKFF
ncbi:hypothetical protein [Methanimicrococcus hacksteinii]|uniref:hypothetical protein n=1 Tax=Methanimicrococcus hacksteinii TaxID=3028293 RepID=UPI00298F316D|nr:hypothetical protein [Methanimicrococcus sp. At1]